MIVEAHSFSSNSLTDLTLSTEMQKLTIEKQTRYFNAIYIDKKCFLKNEFIMFADARKTFEDTNPKMFGFPEAYATP